MINGAYSQNSGAGRRMLEQTTWTFPQEDWLKGDIRTPGFRRTRNAVYVEVVLFGM